MINQDIYLTSPSSRKLVNEGVASVNDDKTQEALNVLRYELETFVCDGQYEKGVEDILDTYLKNVDQAQQPAVWISGFYGSGKSHLVKMLRALWTDMTFPDSATSRGIATLPQNVKDLLAELSTQGKRHGGLHAASGTLGAGASGSVRLALLRIVFKSVGLPEQYPVARFVMWLKSEGIYEQVQQHVENNGHDWNEELDNFYVAEGLHEALCEVKPNLFSSPVSCVETLNNLYPYVQDVSSDDMIKTIKAALSNNGKFPLTLIVLDEVQQYIGEDSQRSIDVQEAVEACCKNIGGKLLFIGTGQTAVTGTSNLKKLEGRFTVRIELSDADVDAVIRQVILAKKAESLPKIEQTLQQNLGEISRHLAESKIGHRQDDIQFFAQDYPILPVRRRFWENTLRVLDQTGTDSQLRNQLSMIHKCIQSNLDKPLGSVIPADYLYFDGADKLLQSRVLPRKVHEKTFSWMKGNDEQQLLARACGLAFLVGKLQAENKEIGIKANLETLADLMVEDLNQSSSALRTKLAGLLDNCELLIKVGDEYRIQTEESQAWNDAYLRHRNTLANEAHRLETERTDRIRKKFSERVKKFSVNHGQSNVPRALSPLFDASLPGDADSKIYVWVRDGWSIDENSVRVDARQAGNTASTIYVHIPKRSADDLRHHLIDLKAATATLEEKGSPDTPEGKEARAAMQTAQTMAESKVNDLLGDILDGVRVFQAGGNEVLGNDLQEMILEAAENSLTRLYPQFHVADHTGWSKVYDKAKTGASDALKAVGDDGEPAKNPVCKAVINFLAGGKKGVDIRTQFESAPYGWPGDAVDGALQVLVVAGVVRAQTDRGQNIEPRELERKKIGLSFFKLETAVVTTPQRIQIRKLLQQVGCQAKQNEELAVLPEFLQKLSQLADNAGGDAPRPAKPNTSHLDDIRRAAGNEQLLAIYNLRDELKQQIEDWQALSDSIQQRLPTWQSLQTFASHAKSLDGAEVLQTQVDQIKEQRLLLAEPDLMAPLLASYTQLLREELNSLQQAYDAAHAKGMQRLGEDSNWQQLEQEQKHQFLAEQKLTATDKPEIAVGSSDDIQKTLQRISIGMLAERIAAMPSRFDAISIKAAEEMEPKAQFIRTPRRTLKTEAEITAWLEEVEQQLKSALAEGPIVLQ